MRRLAVEKKQILKQLGQIVDVRFDNTEADLMNRFMSEYYRDVALEDLASRELEDLYGAAVSHWNLSQTRLANDSSVSVYNPDFETHGWQSPYTVIEIVTKDRSYLVNSLTMKINQLGLTCHLVVHPVINLFRDSKGVLSQAKGTHDVCAESFLRFEVTRQSTNGNKLDSLKEEAITVLKNCTAVTDDWTTSLGKLDEAISTLKQFFPKKEDQDVSETLEFLSWLKDDNFIFLGSREYEFIQGDKEGGFKIQPNSGSGILRDELAPIPNMDVIPVSSEDCTFMCEPCPLIVTKATTKSPVHRAAYMDYVGVKKFSADGEVIGEYRFLGLYTSSAYHVKISEIPLIRKKINKVLARSAFKVNSHSGNSLMNILEGLPRDELFHSSDEQLLSLALGVLQLRERQRIRLFSRTDLYGRFVSILVYVPRDQYHTGVRKKMEQVICGKLGAEDIDFNVEFSESIFARVHFTIHTPLGWKKHVDADSMEAEIVDILRDWKDDLCSALTLTMGDETGKQLFTRYGEGFNASYQENYPARFAVADIEKIESLNQNVEQSIQMSLYQPIESHGKGLQFKLINKGAPAPLSQTLPVLENMGVTVFDERPFEIVDKQTGGGYWVHDFGLIYNDVLPDIEQIKESFQTVFKKVWLGQVENDGFNQLVIKAHLDWKKIMLLRAYYLYLRQAGATFSQAYVEKTLHSNPKISMMLVALFEQKFNPKKSVSEDVLTDQSGQILAEIEQVASLDEDRILRRYLNLIQATVRTNYYQEKVDSKGIPFISFKLNPALISDLPSPRPTFEIFVYSPRVEGVHLRGGAVARGGLRWSDRKEDFRTEVLGLMKAQMSKNAVIVPTGAKGGFIVKRPLDSLSRDEMMKEVVDCYSIFIGALLGITDNLKGEKLIPPKKVVRYDEDDPYLVVAADKGTATFSDIANGLAQEQGFWLGDGFASGGSVGYDHKKMGITAKGAWESVKRHFREMGLDTQSMPFNVIGIGDMNGDVFGNGMLLSKKIRLVGAFNHLHIFLDPDPDEAVSFKERQRLFNMPRSTWSDYEASLISKGGGVYSRADKSIKLSPQVQKLLCITNKTLTPTELIQTMLKAPVDLLWNGGIGTYAKSSLETNDQVGDRANDSLRVNGSELRCKVVGEGGNLGFTQLGRIEYAKNGRINTDAIDNAAGVDCSDHEVNIKILLNKVVEQGDMTGKQRDTLLATMTDEVSQLVLRNNYLQTQAISMVEAQAPSMLKVHARLIEKLVQDGRLDRDVEYLPSQEEIEQRKVKGEGLFRPELAVIFAYSKILLKDLMSGTNMLQDPGFKQDLLSYFPSDLRDAFAVAINEHRLRDDIIVNQLVNSLVNRLGPSFAFRMHDEVGANIDEVVRTYKIACEIFKVSDIWDEIELLDNRVSLDVQVAMLLDVRKLIERSMYWLHSNRSELVPIKEIVSEFSEAIDSFDPTVLDQVSIEIQTRVSEKAKALQASGVGEALSNKVSCLELSFACLDVIAVQSQVEHKEGEVQQAYFEINEKLQIGWLQQSITQLPRKNYWESLARSALRDDLYTENREILLSIFKLSSKKMAVSKKIERWLEDNQADISRYLHLVGIIQAEKEMAIEQLSVILKELHAIVEKGKVKSLLGH